MLKIAALLLLAAPALAQSDTTPKKVQFINMNELGIDVGRTKVPVLYTSARGKVKFERIARLKHSVLPKMKATAKDVSLR